MTKKNNQSCFYNSHRPIDGGNLLVAKIQALRAKIKTLPTGSPELESLKAQEEGLKTELYYKIERLLEKAAGTLYKKVKNLSPCLEPKDFVQEAALGFLRAIDQFDLNQGTKFSTLVCRYGMTAMIDYVRRETHYNHHAKKSDEQDAQRPWKRKPKVKIISLDRLKVENEDGKIVPYIDTVADKNSRSPLDIVIENENRRRAEQFLAAAREVLPKARIKTLEDYTDCGCSIAETARRQRRPYSQVYNEVEQIRKQLRRDLSGFNPAA